MTRLTSRIYDDANAPAPTGAEAKQRNHDACAAMWHRHGLAVIDPAEITDDWTRQAIENEAIRLYGKRGQ
jgi:hypothetical protein